MEEAAAAEFLRTRQFLEMTPVFLGMGRIEEDRLVDLGPGLVEHPEDQVGIRQFLPQRRIVAIDLDRRHPLERRLAGPALLLQRLGPAFAGDGDRSDRSRRPS